MGGPVWLSAIFAAMMLTVAVYCAGRLVAARRWRRPTELDSDGAHVVMGVAMAGMLVSSLRTPVPNGLWEAAFAVGAAWFGGQAIKARKLTDASRWRCRHASPHLVECVAMLYVFLLLPTSAAAAVRHAAGMGTMPLSPAASRFSFLALLMALFLLGYVVVLGDRLTAHAAGLPGAAAVLPGAAAVLPGAPAVLPGAAAVLPGGCTVAGFGRPSLAPRCAVLCKMAMGVTMGYMLILAL